MILSRRRPGPARRAICLSLCLLTTAVAARAADEVASLRALEGLVEVRRQGEWFEAAEGDVLEVRDEVRTDVDAVARIEFLDAHEPSGATATVVDLAPETHVFLQELVIEHGELPSRSGFLDLLRGALHAITKGWQSGSIFSVRAGTTICGIRGSVANIGYDPAEEAATVTSLDGEMFTFRAEDRELAIERHQGAREALRSRRHPAFARHLRPGEQALHRAGRQVRFRRLEAEHLKRAREAVLRHHRRPEGLRRSARWANAFARVKPTGKRSRRSAGKRLREHFRGRRPLGRHLRPDARTPEPGTPPGLRTRPRAPRQGAREELRQRRQRPRARNLRELWEIRRRRERR